MYSLYSLFIHFNVSIETQHVTEVCTFGSGPAPFRRTGCARVGSEVMICGGTRPTEVDYKWKKEKIPLDISDVYILHLSEWFSGWVNVFLLLLRGYWSRVLKLPLQFIAVAVFLSNNNKKI